MFSFSMDNCLPPSSLSPHHAHQHCDLSPCVSREGSAQAGKQEVTRAESPAVTEMLLRDISIRHQSSPVANARRSL